MVPADQPFPLLLATDKAGYRIGDKVTIAVTPVQACNLTVLEFTTSGQVHTLYPNATAPNPAVAALQTVFVAGGPSTNMMQLAGSPGTEQILAVCASSDAGVAPAQKSEVPVDPSTVSRDLTVVASHPGTAMASVVFAVQP